MNQTFDVLEHALTGAHLVEASAGTGKTFNLTTLVVRLLIEAGMTLDRILVVSFARASTADLRGRVRERIAEAIAALETGASGDPVLLQLVRRGNSTVALERLRAALRDFDRAAIYTIHAFCQRALVEFAFESGEPFAVEFLEGADDMYAQVARDHWAATAYPADPDWLDAVSDVLGGSSSLVDLVKHAAERPGLKLLPAGRASQLVELQRGLHDAARARLDQHKNLHNVRAYSDLLVRLSDAMCGPGGEVLADAVFSRYPAALIDEFQDTDPVQFSVFQQVYRKGRGALFLIGDPKQAIYAFRGGDIYAYLRAVRQSPPTTLGVNYRSDEGLVEALGLLYGRAPAPFVDARIPFHPVDADKPTRIRGPAAAPAPLQLKLLRKEGKGKRGRITGEWADKNLATLVAADIVRFLRSDALLYRGKNADGSEVWTSPKPSDCAVLVRKNKDAEKTKRALASLGVPSVVGSDTSVFSSDAGAELFAVLDAIVHPASDRRLRAAVTGSIIGLSANDLANAVADDAVWAGWATTFRGLHDAWSKASFSAVFRRLMTQAIGAAGVAAQERLLGLVGGERLVTNLLHLGELLQQREQQQSLTPSGLVSWFGQRRAGSGEATDDEELRLESDANAATIMTVFKAKGLQFPAVWCPYGHVAFGPDKVRPVFHGDPPLEAATVSLDPAEWGDGSARGVIEAAAQERRILYVSLTRAAHRLTVFWGEWNNGERSALASLLHPPGKLPAGADPAQCIAAAASRAKSLGEGAIMAELGALAASPGGRIDASWLDESDEPRMQLAKGDANGLSLAVFQGDVRTSWRRSSYTELTRDRRPREDGPSNDAPPDSVADHDEGVEDDVAARPPAVSADEAERRGPVVGDDLACSFPDFPRGKRPGVVLHGIFEHVDFCDPGEALERTVAERLAAARLLDGLAAPTAAGVRSVLATDLGGALAGFTLGQLPRARRLDELAFTFPVSTRGQSAPNLRQRDLVRFFTEHGLVSLADRVSRLSFARLRGHLTGLIDLVFELGGRFYVVDYKSNYLGPKLGDYGARALERAVAEHSYDLQYLVYSVAVHRYLGLRLPGYRFADHFGGVRYLFIRGMNPATGAARGVYRANSPEAVVVGLSDLFRAPPGASS